MLGAVDRDQLIERLRAAFAGVARPPIAAWLFGSRARNTSRANSDVDVALLHADGLDEDRRLDLESELAQALGLEVQLIDAARAPADLMHRVLRDGVLFVETDRSARIAFEVASRRTYFDMAPTWREYRRLGEAPR